MSCLFAFLLFCLAASAVYLLNDIVDIESDRHHRFKKIRPLASGYLSLLIGWLSWPLLMITALGGSIFYMPPLFSISLLSYFLLTMAYSLRIKQYAVVDFLTLASLYTLRIVAGAFAISVPLSFWMLAFSIFIFTSLALVKRYSELRVSAELNPNDHIRGRGYVGTDLQLVSQMGVAAAYISILVLALYIQDPKTNSMYSSPGFIWLTCPLLLFWVSRIWLLAHRGILDEDPISFAARDIVSWMVAALFILVFALAGISTL
ncbi:UbiA family prenyltransferase [Polynucleobacter wuianus]|uniref:UbiA family prenyltransferase n=1 Tax=Polynucleobacter wuianus TaxID=1743168 RepID=UPI001C0E63B1|nr:UbiA family prenyltransferase [Polynucleobacter wuianus]MBU3609288.1 UbiA family prenyltransferase [Polynucleobacter wuianus]